MKKTNYTTATTDFFKAIDNVIKARNYGYNAWIEVQKNGEQDYPVLMKNPQLEDVNNWTTSYGVPSKIKENPFNPTHEKLMNEYVEVFSSPKAHEEYITTGKIIEGLIEFQLSDRVKTVVKIKDANHYRKYFIKDNYEYDVWSYKWIPKNNIPYYIPDKNIDEVYVVCYDNTSTDCSELNILNHLKNVIDSRINQIKNPAILFKNSLLTIVKEDEKFKIYDSDNRYFDYICTEKDKEKAYEIIKEIEFLQDSELVKFFLTNFYNVVETTQNLENKNMKEGDDYVNKFGNWYVITEE